MKKQEKIISELTKERNELQRKVNEAQERLKNAPEGNIRIAKHKKGVQFYGRMEPNDRYGVYMHASEGNTARELIQKKYDQKFLREASRMIKAMDDFLKKFDPAALENIYTSMSAKRRAFLSFAELPDDEYAARWLKQEYEPKSFLEGTPEHYTAKENVFDPNPKQ